MQSLSHGVDSLPLFPYLRPLFLQGNVDITDHKIVPADAQLASDYQSVSSEYPPAKKAKDKHAVSNCLSFLITPIKSQRCFTVRMGFMT